MVPKAIEQHGMPYRIVSECWLGANVIGKVPIPAIDCFSHFSPLEGDLGLVDKRCLLLTTLPRAKHRAVARCEVLEIVIHT